ncbi:PE-PPE domain-containing protein [Mycobacterium sp. NPDC048908]|uniref:PE-PPE domain-containing protein n=1 Tax=Mycobacterium sp. NPDC048908 TaxID=3364292 RepID=UPI003712858B
MPLLGIGAPELFGFGGPAWDVPWWKLPGLFDLTLNQSILQGVSDLQQAIAAQPDDDLVIYGYSQSALIANRVKRKLAEQYPAGTKAPDIDFVLGGDENLPNGGLFARFPGLYIPILDWSLKRPRTDRHPVRHRGNQPAVRLHGRLPAVSAQRRRRPERVSGLPLCALVPV